MQLLVTGALGCVTVALSMALSPDLAWANCKWSDVSVLDSEQEETTVPTPPTARGLFESNGTAPCGLNSRLIRAFSSIPVSTKSGEVRFYPLLLTNKSRYKCHKIFVHLACATARRKDDGTHEIRLESLPATTRQARETATFTVDADGRVATQATPFFVLLQAREVVKAKDGKERERDVSERLRQRADLHRGTSNKCIQDAESDECSEEVDFALQEELLKLIRARLMPRTLNSQQIAEGISHHKDPFLAGLPTAQRLVIEMLAASEISDTPYRVSDATQGNSGISFGARQLDIGPQNEYALKAFGGLIKLPAVAEDGSKARLPPNRARSARIRTVQEFLAVKPTKDCSACIQRPIRKFAIDELWLLHRTAPYLDKALNTREGRQIVDAEHRRSLRDDLVWLRNTSKQYPFLRESALNALFALDARNHHGAGSLRRNNGAIAMIAATQRASLGPAPTSEDYFREFIRQRKKRIEQSPWARNDIDRRAHHVEKFARRVTITELLP